MSRGASVAAAVVGSSPAAYEQLTEPRALRPVHASLAAAATTRSAERAAAAAARDAADRCLSSARSELREVELSIILARRACEVASERRRLGAVGRARRGRFLGYAADAAAGGDAESAGALAAAERDEHTARLAALGSEAAALRARGVALSEAHAAAERALRTSHARSLVKLRQEFEGMLQALRGRFADRLCALRAELSLRHRVELRHVEERRNSHIDALLQAHDAAYAEMRRYYNDVTRANLGLIAQLKRQILDAKERAAANSKLMAEIGEENRRLASPLQRATTELNSLQADLRDLSKDRESLRNARARLKVSCGGAGWAWA